MPALLALLAPLLLRLALLGVPGPRGPLRGPRPLPLLGLSGLRALLHQGLGGSGELVLGLCGLRARRALRALLLLLRSLRGLPELALGDILRGEARRLDFGGVPNGLETPRPLAHVQRQRGRVVRARVADLGDRRADSRDRGEHERGVGGAEALEVVLVRALVEHAVRRRCHVADPRKRVEDVRGARPSCGDFHPTDVLRVRHRLHEALPAALDLPLDLGE
mmetsp:Transcript_47238/g.124610  ORF Transcript_47238/g.124610 Transcript_47238/m.124610 type:complete len:221 (+) Transcript_47238:476-1138(+)